MLNNFSQFKKLGNKFGAKKTVIDNLLFDSKAEAAYYLKLKVLKRAGLVKEFLRQVKFDLFAWHPVQPIDIDKSGKTKMGFHKVDFYVQMPDDSWEAHEVKGYATDVWKLKKKLFEANYPTIKYVVIK